MKTSVLKIAVLGTMVGIPAIGLAQDNNTPDQSIQLRIANLACAEVSPNNPLNPNPTDLNDGDLDDAEIAAIEQGCTFRATVSSPNGMRLSGTNLVLRRSVAPHGSFETFGYPRTSDDQGNAVWRFQPTPNTDFIYDVVSTDAGGTSTTSNTVEIQLCTGSDSVGAISGAPTVDAGQGCENVPDGNGGNDGDNNDGNDDDVPLVP